MYIRIGTRNLCCYAAGEKGRQLFCTISSQQVDRGLTNVHQTKYRDLYGEIDTTIDYVNAARHRKEISSIYAIFQHKYIFAKVKLLILHIEKIFLSSLQEISCPFFLSLFGINIINFQKHKSGSNKRWTTTLTEGLHLRDFTRSINRPARVRRGKLRRAFQSQRDCCGESGMV